MSILAEEKINLEKMVAANEAPNLKKMCFKKCKSCNGMKCPNYFGFVGKKIEEYYTGVLHERKPEFFEVKRTSRIGEVLWDDGRVRPVPPYGTALDKRDWGLVVVLITVFTLLTVFGGLI